MRTSTILAQGALLIWSFFVPVEGHPVVVREMNLEEVTASAHSIFSGLCTGSETRYDAETGREAVFVQFAVTRTLKGEHLDHITFKMSTVAVAIGHAPAFTSGDEGVLFLYKKSPLGFTSPVGLAQGAFSLRLSAAGEKVVINGTNNRNLFKGIDLTRYTRGSSLLTALDRVVPHHSGPIGYHTFLTLVEGIVDQH